jgi:hypothetical protein
MSSGNELVDAQNRTTHAVRAIATLLIFGFVSLLAGGLVAAIGLLFKGGYTGLTEYTPVMNLFVLVIAPIVGGGGILTSVYLAYREWQKSEVKA